MQLSSSTDRYLQRFRGSFKVAGEAIRREISPAQPTE